MNRILGSSKPKAPPPSMSDAISNVDARGETMEKKVGKLDAELVKLRDQMKTMREGPSKNMLKQKALRVLKQKRQYEGQMDALRNQAFNMEQSNFAIQSMKDNQVTVAAMQSGLKSFRQEQKKIDIDKIEALQDDMAEMLDINNEIQDAFSRQYDTPDIDEAELEAELDLLGSELGEDTSYLDEALKTPTVPSREPGAKGDAKDAGVLVDEFGLPKVPLPPQHAQ